MQHSSSEIRPRSYVSFGKFNVPLSIVLWAGAIILVATLYIAVGDRIPGRIMAAVQESYAAITFPKDLRTARFGVMTPVGGKIYSVHGLAFVEDVTPHIPNVATVQSTGSKVPEVKQGIVASPDARYTAYTLVHLGTSSAAVAPNTVVVESQDGWARTIGLGSRPYFLDATHLVRFSSQGIAVYDIIAEKDSASYQIPLKVETFGRINHEDDSGLVLFSEIRDNKTHVYHISPSSITPVATYAERFNSSVVSNGTIYALGKAGDGRTAILKYQISTNAPGKVIYSFPKGINVVSMDI